MSNEADNQIDAPTGAPMAGGTDPGSSRSGHGSEHPITSLFAHMAEGMALHELVFDAAGQPIDYRIVDVNPRYCEILGIEREAVVGKLGTEAYGTEHAPYLREFAQAALSGKRGHLATYFPPLERHFEISIAPLGATGFATLFFDVTERKRQEDTLRRTTEELDSFFRLVADCLCITDTDGTFLRVSQSWQRHLGWEVAELVGTNFFELIHPSDRDKTAEAAAALGRGEDVIDFTNRYRHRDGTWRTLEWRSRLGPENRIYASARDVTDRDDTAEQLLRAAEERRALEAQMLQSQKLESLGVLAGGIAHDFNNLLTSMLGNADLALQDLSPLSPARSSIEGVEIAARRAADLCRQLLAYSGHGRFVVQPVDLQELIQEMTHLLTVSISKKAVLKYHFAEGLPAIEADVTQLRQVFMNLITNASEAIDERSGVIAITTGAVDADQEYLRSAFGAEGATPGLYVSLEVSDTGCGMERETLQRIFDPFYTTKFTGRGLGLAAVLGIVRGHKGFVRVYSERGKGTTFKLLFPASEKRPAPNSAPPPVDRGWQPHGTILLADDEETIRALGKRMLSRAGFEVALACDGRETLEVYGALRDEVILVILDLTMPHLDGEACFRELRRLNPDVRVLMSSGYNEQDVVNRFAGKGLAGFVQKPYKVDTLMKKVREALERSGG